MGTRRLGEAGAAAQGGGWQVAHLRLTEDPRARTLTCSVEGITHTAGVLSSHKVLRGHLKEIKRLRFPPAPRNCILIYFLSCKENKQNTAPSPLLFVLSIPETPLVHPSCPQVTGCMKNQGVRRHRLEDKISEITIRQR